MQIVYDNYIPNSSEIDFWGFSLFIKRYGLLVDTGENGRILLKNLKKLGIDIGEISYLFITHDHWDHTGGIDSLIQLNPNITLFVPKTFSKNQIRDLKRLTKEVVVCDTNAKMILPHIYTTGLLGDNPPEQSLIIDDKSGTTLISGCSHFGIENIIAKAKNLIQKDIDTVIGGFHLHDKTQKEILKVITSLKKEGVKKITATHCTGTKAIELFRDGFDKNFIEGGVGKQIS